MDHLLQLLQDSLRLQRTIGAFKDQLPVADSDPVNSAKPLRKMRCIATC